MSGNINEDLLIVHTKYDILIKENSILKNECKKLEVENKALKNQLKEISDYCNRASKYF